jgi:hypothetical protein
VLLADEEEEEKDGWGCCCSSMGVAAALAEQLLLGILPVSDNPPAWPLALDSEVTVAEGAGCVVSLAADEPGTNRTGCCSWSHLLLAVADDPPAWPLLALDSEVTVAGRSRFLPLGDVVCW